MKKILVLVLCTILVSSVPVSVFAGAGAMEVNFNDNGYYLDYVFYEYSGLYCQENGTSFQGEYKDVINNPDLSITLITQSLGKDLPTVTLFPAHYYDDFLDRTLPVSSVEEVNYDYVVNKENVNDVETFIIEEGIRGVLYCNFGNFPSLKTVIIPESVKHISFTADDDIVFLVKKGSYAEKYLSGSLSEFDPVYNYKYYDFVNYENGEIVLSKEEPTPLKKDLTADRTEKNTDAKSGNKVIMFAGLFVFVILLAYFTLKYFKTKSKNS